MLYEVITNDGLYQNSDEILNAPRLLSSTATQPGDIRFEDVNGDGKIDDQDKRIVGVPSFPRATFGFDFNLQYDGWFMNGLFQGTGDRYLGLDNFMINDAKRRTIDFQQDYWTPENPNALYPRLSHSMATNGGNNDNQTNPSDFYLKNAKYFRLKSLQIGYDLKKSVLNHTDWISTCKVYLSGTNLFTISDVMDYFDPEQLEAGGDNNNGVQTFGYPVQRTYSFGINIGF